MFAVLVTEHEPPKWSQLPLALEFWTQDVGGFAATGLAIWLVFYLLRRPTAIRLLDIGGFKGLFWTAAGAAFLFYLTGGFLALVGMSTVSAEAAREGAVASTGALGGYSNTCLTIGGACALLAVALPFLLDLTRLRFRRIGAIARVSLKEAVRRRVLWVFSALLLVLLFASWFIDSKPENQVRSYVHVIYWAMTPMLLVTAGLLAAFSIPADVKSQTIYTIVTKPVERFEIVLGRFIGYTALMTAILAVMTSIGLLYVVRTLDRDAELESKRARVPIFGELRIEPDTGKNVGYEWEYRKFIAGGPTSPDRAIWTFTDIPAELANRKDRIPCEFGFEIFRTTKGTENQGVFCTFIVQTHRWDPSLESRFDQERDRERTKPDADPAAVDDELAQKYGFYKIRSKEVADYHTLSFDIPAGIFRNLMQGGADAKGKPTQLEIVVKCESNTQYVGFAKRDLYVLAAERSFEWNFFKGAFGLWLRLCLVIGLAIACSTYLSGVIAWLTTMFIFISGFFEEFIRTLAMGKSIGGGPVESFLRLVNKEGLTTQRDDTPTQRLAAGSDEAFQWMLRRFLDIIPDVELFDFTDYVAEGFDIAEGRQMMLSLVLLFAYLLPWAILSYYLMKSREVAA